MTRYITDRPIAGEYPPYYDRYIGLVPEGDIVNVLREQLEHSLTVLGNIPESRGDFAYQEGKWTIKDVIGHISDTERIFAYRALRMARGDQQPLPGFEQDDYVRTGDFNERTVQHLLLEFEYIRNATILLFEPLSEDAWLRKGTASNSQFTVRSFPFIIAGHELHHLSVLHERYGVGK